MLTLLQHGVDSTAPIEASEGFTTNLVLGLVAMALVIGVGTWLLFVWAVKSKQFEDIEEVAHRLNELDNQTTTR